MSKNPTFGFLLKQYRGERNLTQQAFADLAGLTQEEVARLEGDHRNPAWVTVHKIARALGLTCEAFADAAEVEAAKPRKQGSKKKSTKGKRKPPNPA